MVKGIWRVVDDCVNMWTINSEYLRCARNHYGPMKKIFPHLTSTIISCCLFVCISTNMSMFSLLHSMDRLLLWRRVVMVTTILFVY